MKVLKYWINYICVIRQLKTESFEHVRGQKYLVNYFSDSKQLKRNVINMEVQNKMFIGYEAATEGKS